MATILTEKFAKAVDERFTKASQVAPVLNNNYSFEGAKTVKVSSMGIAPLVDYNRSGSNRYGTSIELGRAIQEMTLTRDRGFTFTIDAGNEMQSDYVMNAAAGLRREIDEVVILEYDSYVLHKIANVAINNGAYATTSISKSNSFTHFLTGNQYLSDHNVPEEGRYAFCTHAFCNVLMQDGAFVKEGENSQEMLVRGQIGTVDGVKIIRVPANRLPQGAAFLLVAKGCVTAPKQLTSYKTHKDPVGVNGHLVEGRIIYDAFVFDSKVDGVYFHGAQGGIRTLAAVVVGDSSTTANLVVNTLKDADTNKFYYKCAETRAKLPTITAGTAVDVSTFTEIADSTATITIGVNTVVLVLEVDSSNKPVSTAIRNLQAGVD